ncbi:nitrite reductase small subunit NirD [Algiphilus sp.]|uniref:nitrite reductase small subunit NirD n=1 Tax=Algiphilus sp. TaxID=1872431 RepID=UPI00345187D9|nr:nitrite reductase small subunit NirD [Algiphilus sp.]
MADRNWQRICPVDAIVPDTGVCALVDGKQIAIFRLDDGTVRAIDNHDPFSGANVLSRGIVGGLEGERVVASPIYKQHFSLATGRCLEDAGNSVDAYPVKVEDGDIWLEAVPKRRYLPPAPQPEEPASLVVVGNGMVAMRAVEELLDRAPARYRITVFGAEPRGSYNRIQLSSVLSGEQDAEAVTTHPSKWYADNAITFHAGDAVVAIDRTRRCVRSASGREVEYDRLLIATGSDPLIPPIDGAELDGVTTFRDLDDVDALIAASAERRRAVVIGGGLLGLEAASGLCARGMDVTVLHLADHLMERQLDVKAGTMLKATLAERGIRVRLGAETRRIAGSAGRVERVELADGTSVPADLVVIAIGIRPNIALARDAGLACGRGVLVNDTLQTFDPRIYAVGECVEHRGSTYGLVAPLYEQAGICAGQLAGEGGKGYRGSVSGTQLKISGVKVYSAGDINGDEDTEDLVLHDPRRGLYKRLILRSNRVVGTVLFGDTDDGPWYFDLIRTGADVSAMRSRLLFGAAYCEEAA